MERMNRILQKRPYTEPWYRKRRNRCARRWIVVVVVMLALAAIAFYRLVATITPDDSLSAKTTTELLDALESQMVEPEP